MADVIVVRAATALRRVSFHNDHKKYPVRTFSMAEPESSAPIPVPKAKSEGTLTDSEPIYTPEGATTPSLGSSPEQAIADTPTLGPTLSASPRLSRNPSFSNSSSYQEDWDIPPLDRLTVLDLLDNFALPQHLEKISKGISAQTQKLRKSRDALTSRGQLARERMVEEWRHRVPTADEQLDRYRKRMQRSIDRLGKQWNDTRVITVREKVSFIFGVLNIFMSGYIIGAYPELMHLWYSVQIMYYMPIRYYTYHRRGYHYFLADLCYFVNFLLMLSIWAFPSSKRLFTATFCLAFGNNAVAIILWRNSLVFHSFDKVTSLFIHVMPCATIHCMVHLFDPEKQAKRFPGIYNVKYSPKGSPTAYVNLVSMLLWSTIPYAIWQLSYYFFITVRRREKIAAGRPTSFTWLRKSYAKTMVGKFVLSLPEVLQEPAFMLIQYGLACATMLPCPLWFYSRWASAAFLMTVFTWSIYNGATYYIDVFGKRFQKELEAMKAEVAKWQTSPESVGLGSPPLAPHQEKEAEAEGIGSKVGGGEVERSSSLDRIPLLNEETSKQQRAASDAEVSGSDTGAKDVARQRKGVEFETGA